MGAELMQRTVYRSRPFGFDSSILDNILLFSRRNNERDGITGALICRHEVYLQFLEGPKDKIDALFDRIRIDDRHLEVSLLLSEDCSERLFPEWSMKHDPLQPWMWTRKEMESDEFLISRDGIMKVFEGLATEPS